MCVIIIKQKGKQVSREVLKNSSRINPHGLGVVWLDTFELTYHNSKEYGVLDNDRPYIAHFRYATVGAINKANTHPFVCGKNKDELMMMNGTINGYGSKKMTDTEDLAIQLGSTPRHTWKQRLSKFDARFVTINTRNRTFQIFNKQLYTLRDGVWYSKTNVLQENIVAVYGTLKKGFGNYYSYLTNSKHLGRGETKDKYPLVVKGLPFLLDKKGEGENVVVDLFKVSDITFKNLDALEGHPRWYVRRQVPVVVNGKTITAWIYFNPTEENKWNGSNHVKSYERSIGSWQYRGYEEIEEEEEEEIIEDDYVPTCQELDLFDADDYNPNDKNICVECYHDLEHDGFQNYHCLGCDGWFTEKEILRLS